MNLLLHPSTAHQLHSIAEAKPQAILISGGVGMGKQTIAETLITEVLGKKAVVNDPYILRISADDGAIGIENIRGIREFLRRKTAGTASIRRFVVILDAHTMTHEGQNALLKTLEEPPSDTMIILTTSDVTALKDTIRSRAQQLQVLPVDELTAVHFFNVHDSRDVRSAFYMSDGRPGLLSGLLVNKQNHEVVGGINQAKAVLTMNVYGRLVLVDELSKHKENAELLLAGLERVAVSGMRHAAVKNDPKSTKKFYTLSRHIYSIRQLLQVHTNAKLVLTKLMLEM